MVWPPGSSYRRPAVEEVGGRREEEGRRRKRRGRRKRKKEKGRRKKRKVPTRPPVDPHVVPTDR